MGTLNDRYERVKRDRLRLSPRRYHRAPTDYTSSSKTVPNDANLRNNSNQYNNTDKYNPASANLRRNNSYSEDYRTSKTSLNHNRHLDDDHVPKNVDFAYNSTHDERGNHRSTSRYSPYRSSRIRHSPLRGESSAYEPRESNMETQSLFRSLLPSLLYLYKSPKRDEYDQPTQNKPSGFSRLRGYLSKLAFPQNRPVEEQLARFRSPPEIKETSIPTFKAPSPKLVPGTFETPKRDIDYDLKLQELRKQIAAERSASHEHKQELTQKLAHVEAQYKTKIDNLQSEMRQLKDTNINSTHFLQLENELKRERRLLEESQKQYSLSVSQEKYRLESLNKKLEEQTQELDRRLAQLERIKRRHRDRPRRTKAVKIDSSPIYNLILEREKTSDDLEATRQEFKAFLLKIKSTTSPSATQDTLVKEITSSLIDETEPARYTSMASKIAEYKDYFDKLDGMKNLEEEQEYGFESVKWIQLLLQRLNATLEKSYLQKQKKVESLSNDINFLKFQTSTGKSLENYRRLSICYRHKCERLIDMKYLLEHRISLEKLLRQVQAIYRE